LQVKEAYEFFERKFNPEKYQNIRMPLNSFDDVVDKPSSTDKNNGEKKEEEFVSVRDKNKKNKTNNNTNFEFKFHDKNNMNTDYDDSNDYFTKEQMKLDIKKQEYISKFLFTNTPVPRSYRMVDRLNMGNITLGKGKLFGPEDYFGFTLLTLFILMLFLSRKKEYHTFDLKNLENINIYNALRPSEVAKIYEDTEISPIEQTVLNTKGNIYIFKLFFIYYIL
jgi:hypothetical protein